MNKVPTASQVLLDPSASNWLKDALVAASKRDLCDALSDAELLTAILQDRLDRKRPPVYRHVDNHKLVEIYVNEQTGGYRIFVDKTEHECN